MIPGKGGRRSLGTPSSPFRGAGLEHSMKYLPGKQWDCSGVLYKGRNFRLWQSEEISLLLGVNFALFILGNVTNMNSSQRPSGRTREDARGKFEGMRGQSLFSGDI